MGNESWAELAQSRLVKWRRAQIARNTAATLWAVREGQALYGAVDDLKRVLAGGRLDRERD